LRKRPQRVTPWFNDARRRLVIGAKLCIWQRCLSSREQGEAWQEQDALNHHLKDGGSDERNSRVLSQGFLTGISRHSIPTSMAASHLGVVIDPNSHRVPARRRQIRALSRHPEMEPPQHSHQGPRLFRCGTGSATALAIDHRPEHLLVKRAAADAEMA